MTVFCLTTIQFGLKKCFSFYSTYRAAKTISFFINYLFVFFNNSYEKTSFGGKCSRHLSRSTKLSSVGRGYYLDGWPRFFAVQISRCDRLGVDCFLTHRTGGVEHYSFGVEAYDCDLDIQTELFQYTNHPGAGFSNKDLSHMVCL